MEFFSSFGVADNCGNVVLLEFEDIVEELAANEAGCA